MSRYTVLRANLTILSIVASTGLLRLQQMCYVQTDYDALRKCKLFSTELALRINVQHFTVSQIVKDKHCLGLE